MFSKPAFWIGCVYVCFPLGLLLYGWNDIGDAETDRINDRKDSWLFGARPNASLRKQLPWIIAITQLPFVVVFVWFAGWKMLGWFALVIAANALYNSVGKRTPILDLLNQVGYLLIFVLASWLCYVPLLNLLAMLFSALFAMQSHLFGQLMDIDEDRSAGRQSTAVAIGVRPARWLLVGIMVAESIIALAFFHTPYAGVFMFAGAIFFVFDAIWGPQHYPMWFIQSFFVGWNVVILLTMHVVWRYGLLTLG